MFKCTECEKIYDIKPDYCDDCGNDEFEEIVEKIPEQKLEEPVKTFKEPAKETFEKEVVKEKAIKEKREIDYFSLGFLGICILLSLFIIFFAWNPKDGEIKPDTEETNVENVADIPSLDSFWNNEPPKVQPKAKIEPAPVQIQQPVQKTIPAPQPAKQPIIVSKDPIIKPVQKPASKVAQQPKQVQKPVSQPKVSAKPSQSVTQKQVQPKVNKPSQTTVTQPVKQSQPTQKPAVVQQVKPAQTIQQVQPSVDTTALKKELNNYKIGLRNAIGRKIDFARVIGDGSCTVSFKISPTGALINRTFSQQSSNSTLNDAVFAAVKSTPTYNPPPSGYKNETLHLKITFYNGNFQITLN